MYVLPFDCCCDAGPLWTWACCHRRRHEGPPVSALLSRNGSRAHAWSKRADGLALRLRLFNGNKGPHSGDAAIIMEGSEQQVHRKILFFMTKTTRRLVWPGDQDRPLARRPTFVAQRTWLGRARGVRRSFAGSGDLVCVRYRGKAWCRLGSAQAVCLVLGIRLALRGFVLPNPQRSRRSLALAPLPPCLPVDARCRSAPWH